MTNHFLKKQKNASKLIFRDPMELESMQRKRVSVAEKAITKVTINHALAGEKSCKLLSNHIKKNQRWLNARQSYNCQTSECGTISWPGVDTANMIYVPQISLHVADDAKYDSVKLSLGERNSISSTTLPKDSMVRSSATIHRKQIFKGPFQNSSDVDSHFKRPRPHNISKQSSSIL